MKTAKNSFVARKNEFDALLAKLAAYSESNFGVGSLADANYADVGSVEYAVERLHDIADHYRLDV